MKQHERETIEIQGRPMFWEDVPADRAVRKVLDMQFLQYCFQKSQGLVSFIIS